MLVREVVEMFLHNRKHQLGCSDYTISTYEYALNHFIKFMENDRKRTTYQTVNRLDILAFNEYITGCVDRGEWSRSRFLLVVKSLKAMFGWMDTDEDCREEELKSWRSRMPKGGKTPRREYIPSPSELKRWQRAFNTKTATGLRDYAMFCTFLETGIRRGELVSIKVENFHPEQSYIYVPKGKTGPRSVTITKSLSDRIRMYLRKRERSVYKDSPWLFPSRSSLNVDQNPEFVSKIFRRIKKRMGLPQVTPHTLRHAFCTYFIERGGGVEQLRLQSGHATYEAMQHYMHLAKVRGDSQQKQLEKASPLKMLDQISPFKGRE